VLEFELVNLTDTDNIRPRAGVNREIGRPAQRLSLNRDGLYPAESLALQNPQTQVFDDLAAKPVLIFTEDSYLLEIA